MKRYLEIEGSGERHDIVCEDECIPDDGPTFDIWQGPTVGALRPLLASVTLVSLKLDEAHRVRDALNAFLADHARSEVNP